MNYLAHAYFSYNDPEVLVGNMISDFVKGKKKFDFPVRIQAGIMLHRTIDNYTDEHPATRQAKEFFRPHYRLYSGAFIDVVYDHFLANDPEAFNDTLLFEFSQKVYGILERYAGWLPENFARLFPYMRSQNWLYNYHTRRGTEKSFSGIVQRSAYLTESSTASRLFDQHYQPLQQCYRHFVSEARPFIFKQYGMLAGPGSG
jgi:acyl carrier protein phosphodiesterase